MIKLQKEAVPPILITNKEGWTAEFIGGVDKRRYAHPAIRQILALETARKCAYCESRMEHVAPSHVEHIIPKSVERELVCEWTNLTLACPQCNAKKGNYCEPACPLVNPYMDDPDIHLRWVGPMVFDVTPDRGKVTVSRLALNRAELLYQRAQRIDRARSLLQQISESAPPVARALEQDLRNMQLRDAEFSAAVAAFVYSESTPGSQGDSSA